MSDIARCRIGPSPRGPGGFSEASKKKAGEGLQLNRCTPYWLREIAGRASSLQPLCAARRRRRLLRPRSRLINAANRARNAGVPFELTEGDFEIPSVCPVLGIPLVPGKGRRGPTDSSPTLDRIISSRGYVRDNVVVVSWRANRLKSDGTMTELETIVRWYRSAETRALRPRQESDLRPFA